MRRRAAALLFTVMAFAACGDGEEALSQAAAIELADQVQLVRAAAEEGETEDARVRLARLRAAVAELRDRGEVSEGQAARILAAADAVEGALALITTTTAPRSTTTTTAAPPPPSEGEDEPRREPPGPDDGDDEDEGDEGRGDTDGNGGEGGDGGGAGNGSDGGNGGGAGSGGGGGNRD